MTTKKTDLSPAAKVGLGIIGVAQIAFAFLAFWDLALRSADDVRGPSAPKASETMASSASRSVRPLARIRATHRSCCAATAIVSYSAAICRMDDHASCSDAIVSCADSSEPECCTMPNSTVRALAAVLSPGCGPACTPSGRSVAT